MEFEKNPKMARLYRDVCITEKIDGTHGAIFVDEYPDGEPFVTGIGSRNRFITPGKSTDNFGFARWVEEHNNQLAHCLGPGVHRGEWWGSGIQRGYGLVSKVFSLFAVHLFDQSYLEPHAIPGLSVVPVLYRGPYTDDIMRFELEWLSTNGSRAAPGFNDPEGIVMYHEHSKQSFKYTLDGDGHKGAR